MDKYFKVPMAAARAIVDSSDGPELLAGYMVLRRWAVSKELYCTAAGAKAIRTWAGISDWRAKKVMRDLLALRFGEHGELFFIEDTGLKIKNATKYRFGEWGGSIAYVPDIFIKGETNPLRRLLEADGEEETRRDALMMLLHVHAIVDYGEFFGADPNQFVYKKWTGEGIGVVGDDEVDLGYAGESNGLHFWLMREDDDGMRFSLKSSAESIYGAGATVMERFWAAHSLLMNIGTLCRVAMVETSGRVYPLWIFAPAYREALGNKGFTVGLGDDTSRVAGNAGFDPGSIIVRLMTGEDRGEAGTGLFFVVTRVKRVPVVRTIYAPMFHAPTPLNLSGLTEITRQADGWLSLLGRKSRGKRTSRVA